MVAELLRTIFSFSHNFSFVRKLQKVYKKFPLDTKNAFVSHVTE